MNNLQLARSYDGSGNLRLMFWDSNHGRDVIIVITPNRGIFVEELSTDGELRSVDPEAIEDEFYKLMAHMEACENDN